MKNLTKTDNYMFDEYWVGVAESGAKVVCILDDNCVRYTVYNRHEQRVSRHTYKNANKALCIRNATEAFNEI